MLELREGHFFECVGLGKKNGACFWGLADCPCFICGSLDPV